jgi:hypothetical protein
MAVSASSTAWRGSPVLSAVRARLQRRRMVKGWSCGMAVREDVYEA